MKTIEVEVRGRLTDEDCIKLKRFLTARGEFVEKKNRVLLDYSTFLPEEGIRERTKDIRLRVTNGQPEIITKIGKWGGQESRKEISVKTESSSFDALVQTYAVLGFTKAVLCVRNTDVYTYKDIEFAVVEVPGHSYYFEAECLVGTDVEVPAAHEKIEKVCEKLGLTLFGDNELHDYIEELNQEANEVFDFNDYQDGYFAQRFDL